MRILTIPKGWQEIQLNDLCDFRKGSGLSKGKLRSDGKNECILYGELYTTYSEVINDVKSRTSIMEGVGSIAGDVLVPASTTTCAMDLAIAAVLNKDNVLLGGDINILRNRTDNYDSTFLAYLLSHFEKINLARFAQGSTIIHLYGKDFKKLHVCIPIDKQEQQKIAEVFIACDKAIDKIVAKIDKLKKIKQGLMQDFFRYGIDEYGQMRSEATHRFKDSFLGRIPEEWDANIFKNFKIEVIDGDRGENYPNEKELLQDGYCVFLNNKNIAEGKFIFKETQFISEEKNRKLRKGKLEREDIVITSRGTIGNIAYYSSDTQHAHIRINSGMLVFRNYQNEFDPKFFVFLWNYVFEKQYALFSSGSAQPQLPIRILNYFTLLKPQKNEQSRIASILFSFDEVIGKEEAYKNKLLALKAGLIEDFLSGTVRVNHLTGQIA